MASDGDDLEERVRQLEQRLQEARVKLAVNGRSQMNTISVGDQCDKSMLRPTVFAEVRSAHSDVDRHWFPGGNRFVGLRFSAARGRDRRQTIGERRLCSDSLSPSEVSLKVYGGQPLDILSQVHLELSYGNRTVKTSVLVQPGAPHHLQLGTDTQPKLGFSVAEIPRPD